MNNLSQMAKDADHILIKNKSEKSNGNALGLSDTAHSALKVYAMEARLEMLRMLRLPSFALPALIFPAMFYLLFGILMNGKGRTEVATYLLATYSVFGVMGPGLFGFGVSVAMDRERGWLKWRRALPSSPGAYFLAKMLMAQGFALIIFLELALIAAGAGGVQLSTMQWLQLLLNSIFSALPFCALGLVIGAIVPAQAAPAIVNFVYLPMAFLSGLWMPINMLPDVLGKIAAIWPSYHAGQIALHIVGHDSGAPLWQHLAYLLMFTLMTLWLAMISWSRMKLK